jgi:hypothetical protein
MTRSQKFDASPRFATLRHASPRFATRRRLTVAEWVRQALRQARRDESVIDPLRKLAAVREAARGDYPTADIQQMLTEITGEYATNRST